MCDTFLSNLYTLLNDDSNTQSDKIPSVFLFSGANCTGDMYPNDCSGGIAELNPFFTSTSTSGVMPTAWSLPSVSMGSYTYTSADPICKNAVRGGTDTSYIPYFSFINEVVVPDVRSFVIPFNIKQITLHSATISNVYYYSKYIGPSYVSDTYQVNWQGKYDNGVRTPDFSTHMSSHPVNGFKINESYANDSSLSYLKNVVKTGCLGSPISIGGIQMTRYMPRSARCDAFMSNQYCVSTYNAEANPPTLGSIGLEECSCFSDQEKLLDTNIAKGIVLPVICFGKDCATKDTYKTRTMVSLPCNATVCQSTVKETGNVLVENQDKIYCGGRFYNNIGEALPEATPPLDTKQGVKATDKPIDSFYSYIMIGAAAIFLALFVYLLLAPKPSSHSKVLDRLESRSSNT